MAFFQNTQPRLVHVAKQKLGPKQSTTDLDEETSAKIRKSSAFVSGVLVEVQKKIEPQFEEPKVNPSALSEEDAIKFVGKESSVRALELFAEAESNGQNRINVIVAITARVEDLLAAK